MATKIVKMLELPREDDAMTNERLYLCNHDLLPIPVKHRVWGRWTYFLFWFAEGSSITSLTTVGTAVKNGLSWWEAFLAVIVSHIIVALFMVSTGRPGATYHVPFPVIVRSSFGTWGSYLPLVTRNILTIIWTGVQFVTTGNCFYLLLHSLTPGIAQVHNPFSSDVSMTGGKLIGFSIGWVITLSLCYVPFHKFQKLVVAKAPVMMFFMLAFLIWGVVKAGGAGATITKATVVPAGMTHGWLWIAQFMIQLANQLTFATNNADIARYARKPSDAFWPQIVGYPLGTGIVSFFGCFIVSTSGAIYGTVMWDPVAILDGFLLMSYDAPTRCGIFFIALGFCFAQVTTMIFANLIAAGNDTAAMFPRFINVRRGAIIAVVLAFAITPWNLSKTSFAFTNYLNSYGVFLAGFIGIIFSDYFIIRRGFYDIHSLFSGSPTGIYHFTGGFNLRAFAAYFIAMAPFMPGFAAICGAKGVPQDLQYLFSLAALIQTIIAAVLYTLFCYIWPMPGTTVPFWTAKWNEVEPSDGFIPVTEAVIMDEIFDEEKAEKFTSEKSPDY